MNQSAQQPGFMCPECSHFIHVTLEMLLRSEPIRCPACGLALHLDHEESRDSLAAVQKIVDAIHNVREVREQWE